METSTESKGLRVLVTGASAGIGTELARVFAEHGCELVLTARREQSLLALAEELRQKHGVRADVLPADLNLPEAPDVIARALAEKQMPIDVLVNNAGFGIHGKFLDTDLDEHTHLVQVNITALLRLTHLLVPAMVQRGRGGVLNVASIAAYQPGPLMATYYASKAFVLSFSEALRHELRKTGVAVTALCPGPTTSEFEQRAGVTGTRLFRGKKMSARVVAEAGYQGLQRNARVVIPGMKNRITAALASLTPRGLTARLAGHLNVIRKPYDKA